LRLVGLIGVLERILIGTGIGYTKSNSLESE